MMSRQVTKRSWIHVHNQVKNQNLTTSSRSPLVQVYQVWSTSITVFISYLADRQTDRQTNMCDHNTHSASVQRHTGKD